MNNQRGILIRAYKTGDFTVTEGVVSNYKFSQTARYQKGSADYRVVYDVKADDGKNIAINYTFSAHQPYYGAQPEVNALNNRSGNVVSFDYTSTELIKFVTDSKSLHDGTHVRITHADGNVLDLYDVIKYEVAQD
ncbi:MAG: hypothetical protein HQK89_06940 [Nitrospirae bacterium]|nr:hypothetical protein [Nitrospirota bacterium]